MLWESRRRAPPVEGHQRDRHHARAPDGSHPVAARGRSRACRPSSTRSASAPSRRAPRTATRPRPTSRPRSKRFLAHIGDRTTARDIARHRERGLRGRPPRAPRDHRRAAPHSPRGRRPATRRCRRSRRPTGGVTPSLLLARPIAAQLDQNVAPSYTTGGTASAAQPSVTTKKRGPLFAAAAMIAAAVGLLGLVSSSSSTKRQGRGPRADRHRDAAARRRRRSLNITTNTPAQLSSTTRRSGRARTTARSRSDGSRTASTPRRQRLGAAHRDRRLRQADARLDISLTKGTFRDPLEPRAAAARRRTTRTRRPPCNGAHRVDRIPTRSRRRRPHQHRPQAAANDRHVVRPLKNRRAAS